jgi:hypothetical protein
MVSLLQSDSICEVIIFPCVVCKTMVRNGPKRTAAAIGEVNRQQASEVSSSKRSRKKSIEKPMSDEIDQHLSLQKTNLDTALPHGNGKAGFEFKIGKLVGFKVRGGWQRFVELLFAMAEVQKSHTA